MILILHLSFRRNFNNVEDNKKGDDPFDYRLLAEIMGVQQ